MTVPLVCTAVTRRRRGMVRSLARAVARHHEGEALVVLLVDEVGETSAGGDAGGNPGATERAGLDPLPGVETPVEIVRTGDLALEPWRRHELAWLCSGDDLAACFAPALVAALLGRGRPVVWLSPEVVMLAALDDLVPPGGVPAVLVPRLLGPPPSDGWSPSEAEIVDAGPVDPGIVAVAPGASAFLDWWQRSLRHLASSPGGHPSRAQPALGFAPQLFGAQLCRAPGVGVAAWNAHERAVSWSATDGYRAGGAPLVLAHLQGFDPEQPYLVGPAGSRRPRVLLSENPALRRLCDERAQQLQMDGSAALEPDGGPSAGTEPPGRAEAVVVDERMRRIVRRAAASARWDEQAAPDPDGPAGRAPFYDWLAAPDPADPLAPEIPRYLVEVYRERADLVWHFPRLATVDAARFRQWVGEHGLDEARVPPALRTALAATPWWSAPTGAVAVAPAALRPGVALAGYLRAESGVGEAARLALDVLVSAGVEVSAVTIGARASRQLHEGPPRADAAASPRADRRINLVWVNADQLPGFASVVGPEFFDGRYNVGFWAWETELLPASMAASAAMLDEIWVPSSYVRDAVAPAVDREVHVFPHPVVEPSRDASFDAAALGVPDGFCFLYTYDFLSGFDRKNPLGVLAAFTTAFSPGAGPVLVLKSVNGDQRRAQLEQLLIAASERPDVAVVDGYLTSPALAALIDSCQCYVSLHRAEGFGLAMGEAMALAKPVIATRYSGNLDFMDDETALLVPGERVRVGPGREPYDATDHWFDPDVGAAAELMRRVAARPDDARVLGQRARDRVLREHGVAQAERFVRRRVDAIEKKLRKGYSSAAADAVRRFL